MNFENFVEVKREDLRNSKFLFDELIEHCVSEGNVWRFFVKNGRYADDGKK